MKKIGLGIGSISFFAPVLVFAQTGNLQGLLSTVFEILNILIPIVVAIAFLYFLWALTSYLLKLGESQDEARNQMLWGLIVLFVMVAAWGLVGIIANTFGVQEGQDLLDVPAIRDFEFTSPRSR
ncbi:MAG: hypothetical protein WDZ90_00965 [Candidatus Paceibacterota bacterium]